MDRNTIINLFNTEELGQNWLEKTLFPEVKTMKDIVKNNEGHNILSGIIMATWFEKDHPFRLACESAMARLGGKNIYTFGKSLEDIRLISSTCCPDIILLRTKEEETMRQAISMSPIPVINAGVGKSVKCPVQKVTDLYTRWNHVPSPLGFDLRRAENMVYVMMALFKIVLAPK
ncbi:MAG: hypothetical protein AAB959_00765 [Patescibacteria group bacterium]|mgnify:CR=1 FL=1